MAEYSNRPESINFCKKFPDAHTKLHGGPLEWSCMFLEVAFAVKMKSLGLFNPLSASWYLVEYRKLYAKKRC